MADDKIIYFPSERIVNKENTQNVKQDSKFAEKVRNDQTKKFIETAVDDISMELLRKFADLAMKTDRPEFMKDLALLVDIMRGMIYRDFELKHASQTLSDKIVEIGYNKHGGMTAKLNYAKVLEEVTTKPKTSLSTEIKKELKDINDTNGFFEPDGELDD